MTIEGRALAPGSVPYGERDDLEAGLSQVAGGAGGAPAPQAPTPTLPARGNPFSDLISGELSPQGGDPLTAGLSVGPGAGPAPKQSSATNLAQKLKLVATQARSPVLRRMAYERLRRLEQGSR